MDINMKRRVVNKGDTGTDNTAPQVTVGSSRSANNANMRHNGSSTSNGVILPALLIIIGVLVGFTIYQNQQFEAKSQLLNDNKVHEIQAAERKFKLQLDAMTQKLKTLETQLQNKKTQNKRKDEESNNRNSHNEEELEKTKHESATLKMQLEHLQKEVQRHDKHAVVDKYGEGPHRLKFQLDFPPSEIPEGKGDSFIIEMAPIDLVSLFLFYCSLVYNMHLITCF